MCREEPDAAVMAEAEAFAADLKEDQWTIVSEDPKTGRKTEVLRLEGSRQYKFRGHVPIDLGLEDALVCFLDMSPAKALWAQDYKELRIDEVLRSTGTLPGGLHEEVVASFTINFQGVMKLFKPFFPASMTVVLGIEKTPRGEFKYKMVSVPSPADLKPDGKVCKAGVMQAHPSGDADKCLLAGEETISNLIPLKLITYVSRTMGEKHLISYIERYKTWKAGQS